MADSVRKVQYCYTKIPNRAGHGAKALAELRNAGIDLVAFTGFPAGKGKAQLDFVTTDVPALKRAAKQAGWNLSGTKRGFLVQGQDRSGAVQRHLSKLAERKIGLVAVDAVAAGKDRYGMILWVRPKDYRRAARALGAR